MPDKEDRQPQRCVTPMKGVYRDNTHLLIWCEIEASKRPGKKGLGMDLVALRPTLIRADDDHCILYRDCTLPPILQPEAGRIIDALPPQKAATVWFPRGWIDFVLSGMSALIDSGEYTWQTAHIDGQRLFFRGQFLGRKITLASLANWTGGSWDDWRGKVTGDRLSAELAPVVQMGDTNGRPVMDSELTAIATLHAIISGCASLRLGTPAATAGSQARKWWRIWGGISIIKGVKKGNKCSDKEEDGATRVLIPLPWRPPPAAASERHASYGMAREQYYRGHVGGKVHVMDMESAYFQAMLAYPLPAMYDRRHQWDEPADLKKALKDRIGLALVLIDDGLRPYPIRRGTRSQRAVGQYWTWLAGAELARAAGMGAVIDCHTCWLWHAIAYTPAVKREMYRISTSVREAPYRHLAPVWRSIYCSLVGGYAQWNRQWVDADFPNPIGSWLTWQHEDPYSREITRWRCMGGRSQYRADVGDDGRAVPIMYACVLASLRIIMDVLRDKAGPNGVLAMSADSLWLTDEARDRLTAALCEGKKNHIAVRMSHIYDDAWLDGHGRAVVQEDGRRYIICSGIPSDAVVREDGRSHWYACDPWSSHPESGRRAAVKVRERTVSADMITARHDYPLVRHVGWWQVYDTILPEDLLIPLRPRDMRSTTDE